VRGLEIQMQAVLPVQAVHGLRQRGAQAHDLLDSRQHGLVQPALQGRSFDVLHDQPGLQTRLAGRDVARRMRPAQGAQGLLLDLETQQGALAVQRVQAGELDEQGRGGRDVDHGMGTVQARAQPLVDAVSEHEATDGAARPDGRHRPSSRRSAKKSGRPARRMASAAA
jgi:hypothetical protein